jgi:dodecin
MRAEGNAFRPFRTSPSATLSHPFPPHPLPSFEQPIRAAISVGFLFGDGNPCVVYAFRGYPKPKERQMSVARITEISATSKKSFEDAILIGIDRASGTLRNVKGAWVKDQEVMVENGKPVKFKVILKVTFVLDD